MRLAISGGLGDRLFTVAAIALATLSGGFGGYMVIRLERMENPPLMMGLDFSSLKEVEPPLVDPIVTGTIDRDSRLPAAASRRRLADPPPALEFRLLSVVDGVAFVEVLGPDGTELHPVDVGANLPGAGEVRAITRDGRYWRIQTETMVITGDLQ